MKIIFFYETWFWAHFLCNSARRGTFFYSFWTFFYNFQILYKNV